MAGAPALNDQALGELCRLLEEDNSGLAPDAVWLSGRPYVYAHLQEIGALLPGMELAPNLVCRDCCSETIRPVVHPDATSSGIPYRGHCPECGWIELNHEDAHFWSVQPLKIARWLAAALQLGAHYVVEPVVDGVLWRLGEIEHRRRRRTVFFGRRLPGVAAEVDAKLNELVAPGAEVIITSIGDDALLRRGALASRTIVPLRAVAHFRKAGFVIENLDAYLANPAPAESSAETSLRLMETRRVALIDGEAVKLSPQVYAFLKILVDADGDEVHKRHIAERLGIEAESFRTADVFKRHKSVYETCVGKDDKGNYWLRPEFLILEGR